MVFLLEKQKNLNDYIFKKAEAEIKSTKYEEDIFDLKNKNINELIVDYAKRSMIQYDLDNKANGLAKQLAELEADSSRLEEACKTITIPSQVMDDYARLTDMLPYTVNKKRKECERDLKKITDEYKNIANERAILKKFIDKKKEIVILNKSIKHIIKRLEDIKKEINSKTDKHKETEDFQLILDGEDHTMGEIINYELQNHPTLHCGMSKPDLLIKSIVFKIVAKEPSKLFKSINETLDDLTEKYKYMLKIAESLKQK